MDKIEKNSIIVLTDYNYSELIELNNSVNKIIKFGTKWCGPCKIVGEIIKKHQNLINTDYVIIYETDVEDSPKLADKYNIQSVPTIVVLDKNNNETERLTGSVTEDFWKALVTKWVDNPKSIST